MLADRSTSFTQYVDRKRGLVNRKIFVDDDIYARELDQIFARCWLYLAHESQIAEPNDFVNVFMGSEPVIVCRDADGGIGAFINSCRHRGNKICRADAGNTKAFVCPYHGWTFDTRGDLQGVPGHRDLYHGEITRADWGLVKVAQIANYRGLIFGTFDPEAPPLEEYLGDVRWGLDLLFDQGEFAAVPNITRWSMDVNWKFASDNAIGDMYHGSWSHRSAMMAGHTSGNGTSVVRVPKGASLDGGFTLVTAYGHGFNANFVDGSAVNLDTPIAAWRKDPAVQARLGPLRSRVNRANMLIFPNLFVNSGSRELMLRNPLGPGRMEIWKTILVDKNASPETQRMQVRASNRHFGPAGMFEQDDGENWDQSTAGARGNISQRYDLNYAMGLGHGKIVDDGQSPPRIDTLTNENAQLWMYHVWSEFMDAENWPALRANHDEPRGVL
jgi:phenylpropionate dioxygenase-like ring-hydroxylating dioxygenase large terminal subunit